MDFLATFDEGAAWEPFTKWTGQQRLRLPQLEVGRRHQRLHRQLHLRARARAARCSGSPTAARAATSASRPRTCATKLASDRYLHVRMSSDIPSTGRRYPQIMVTNVPLDARSRARRRQHRPRARCTPASATSRSSSSGRTGVAGTADDVPAMGGRTIVVQPFGGYQETQIEFCDTRGWGVSQQCDRANVYGFHAGDYQDTWKQAWTAVPVQGDVAGFDRAGAVGRLHVDERACTCSWTASRPACAVLPSGRMPAGAGDGRLPRRRLPLRDRRDGHARRHRAQVRARLQHLPQRSPHGRLRHRAERRRPPPGTRRVLPCGTKWYGGT